MKIKLGNIDPQSVPFIRGGFYVRDTKRGPIAQKWPRGNKATETLLQWQYRQRFAFAARMASTPVELELQTAIEMAKGTEQVPRDILTMCALGKYYEFQNEDGTMWGHVEGPVNTGPIPPPEDELMEYWFNIANAYSGAVEGGAFATKGNLWTPRENATLKGMKFVANWVAGATYIAGVYEVDATHQITAIVAQQPVSPPSAGKYAFGVLFDFDIDSTKTYAMTLSRTDSADTTNVQLVGANAVQYLYSAQVQNRYYLAKANPQVGDTFSSFSATAFSIATVS